MKFEINLPDEFEVTSREQTVKLDVTKLTVELMEKLALHGMKQKIADAAAGAKKFGEENKMSVEDATKTLMAKVVTNLESGEWGTERGAGTGMTEFMREVVSVLRPKVKAMNPAWYKAAKEAERVEACLAAYEGSNDATRTAIDAIVEGKLEAKRLEAEALAALKF